MASGSETFPRILRLTQPKQYQQVFKTGRRSRHSYMGVMAIPNDLGHFRLGLAVSRKVSKKAVVRNRIKRVARELFRRQQTQLAALDFVIVAYPSAARATSAELREALWQMSQKMCQLCAKS